MAVVMLQAIYSFYITFSKNSLFISANTIENYIASKEYCFSRHNDKMFLLPNCRCHIIVRGDLEELLKKLNAFCFNYQNVDCLYTIFKSRFNGKTVFKGGKRFDIVQRAVHFKHQNREEDRMPSIKKRRLL